MGFRILLRLEQSVLKIEQKLLQEEQQIISMVNK